MNRLAKVFLLTDSGDLSVMTECSYNTEDMLQAFLAKYPDLLAGDQINPEDPRRWLLIRREMGIPAEAGTGDRWSLDHLFVDQDGVPTFVECKRSSDTRSRREVVAQMLDYAANATQYWPMDKLQQSAAETAQRSGTDLDAILPTLLNTEDREVIEKFWQNVEQNLKDGRIRLVFVSDSIPQKLKRIVEFLNEQMGRTEVVAVEIKQFEGSGARVMVPRVIGITEAARQIKNVPPRRRPWTVEEFENNVIGGPSGGIVRKFLDLGREWERKGIIALEGGKGLEPSIILRVGKHNFLTLYAGGTARIYYGFWGLPEFITKRLQSELCEQLGNSEEIRKKEPNIMPLLEQFDPELKNFKPWLEKVMSEIQRNVADVDGDGV